MPRFCYETHPLPLAAIKRRPPMAMDAAPPLDTNRPMIPDDAFTKIIEVLKEQLDEATFGKVRDTLARFTKMSMDDLPRNGLARGKITADGVERAVDVLRAKGVDEGTISEVYKISGVEKPSPAMDSARRERHAKSYAEQFPNAARIVGDAAVRVHPVNTSASARAAYDGMFPQAQRLG